MLWLLLSARFYAQWCSSSVHFLTEKKVSKSLIDEDISFHSENAVQCASVPRSECLWRYFTGLFGKLWRMCVARTDAPRMRSNPTHLRRTFLLQSHLGNGIVSLYLKVGTVKSR